MTDITELAQSLKRRAASANEFGESLYVKADDVLALVEALEKAQVAQPCEHSMFWDASGVKRCSKCDLPEHANVHYADAAEMEIAALRLRIAELESRTVTVKLPEVRITVAESRRRNMTWRELGAYNEGADVAAERIGKELTAQGIKWEAE
ncbi:hypothetical protein [Klebsiella aerogenes]|uniref:hypothetical protein n=1 Tax=Klebsiella aerogenes TaxID=548 RepID=UPI002FFBC007